MAEYIVQNYYYSYCQIIDREANGRDLEKTADESQDLVFVSNVFPLIKYSDTYRYFLEMIRVCKVGGYVVFDAHTEDTLLESVLSDENNYANEWRILPNNVIENIFEQRNMKLISKFKNHMAGGKMDTPLFNIVESWFVYKKV